MPDYSFFMPPSRQLLAGGITSAVAHAIDTNDQKRGRQLATLFERQALVLRARFGGKSLYRIGSTLTTWECCDCLGPPFPKPFPAVCPHCKGDGIFPSEAK